MAGADPDDPRSAASREGLEDALGRLEERLDRASEAAERLLGDAARRVTEGRAGATGRLARLAAAERRGRDGAPLLPATATCCWGCSLPCATGSRPISSSGSPRRSGRSCSRSAP